MEVEFHKDFTDKHGFTMKAGRRAHVTRRYAEKAKDHCTVVGSESTRHTMDRTSMIETGMAPDRERLSDEATEEPKPKSKK